MKLFLRRLREALRRDPLVIAAAAVVLAGTVVEHSLSFERGLPWRNVTIISLLLLFSATIYRERRAQDLPEERRFWNDLAAAGFCWMLGEIVQLTGLAARFGDRLAEICFLLYYVFFILAGVRRPGRRNLRISGSDAHLPAIAIFILGLFLYFFLPAFDPGRTIRISFGSLFLYTILDIFLVVRFFLRSQAAPSKRLRSIYRLLSSASVFSVIADILAFLSISNNDFYAATVFGLILAASWKNLSDEELSEEEGSSFTPEEESSWWTLIYALTFPFLHLILHRGQWLDPAQEARRELFVLWWALLLGIVAFLQQAWVARRRRMLEEGRQVLQAKLEMRRRFEEEQALLIWQLESKNREIEMKNTEMERFTYSVSHDLKAPLFTIQGFLEMLEKGLDQNLSERAEGDIQQIRRASDKMQQMLEELLELAEAGRLVHEPQAISMNEIAREAVDLVAGRIAAANAATTVAQDLPIVYGDPKRLVQMMQNLVQNAVKFLGDQSAPEIEIGCRVETEDTIFYVRDNGVGIDPKDQKKIFDVFRRLRSDAPGTGLGLAVVQRIIDVHGGRIWAESEGEGRGTTMCFTLPLSHSS